MTLWDNPISRVALAALLATPLVFAGHSLYQYFTRDVRPGSVYLLLYIGLVLVILRAQASLIRQARYLVRARSLGCGKVPVFKHKDYLLGLDWVIQSRRAVASYSILELIAERFQTYGNTHYANALGSWLLQTQDPENIKAILYSNFADWPIIGPRQWAVLPVLGPDSIFTNNGQEWHTARATIRPSFIRDNVGDLALVGRHVDNFFAAMPAPGVTFDAQKLAQAITMDSITDFMLGYSTGLLTNVRTPEVVQFLNDFDWASHASGERALQGPLFLMFPSPTLNAARSRMVAFIRFYMRKAQEDQKNNSEDKHYVFLNKLLESGASEDYVVDQILTIMLAGRDTTTATLSAGLWYLARHPEVVEELRREIQDVATANPTYEQLKGMKFLSKVIKETLRLFPPVPWNGRAAARDTVLPRGGGPDGSQPVLVPEGQTIRFNLYTMQRRRDIFGPDADEFRPSRWDDPDPRLNWAFVPFHKGPRICIGQDFALTQISYIFYRIFWTFSTIEPRDDGPMLPRLSFTASLKNGCLVALRE